MMIVFIILVLIAALLIAQTVEPPKFTQVKERYAILREYVKTGPEKFRGLAKCIVLTGYLTKNSEIGYNTNKGYEIGLCLDGTVNQTFHVLLHELTHSTVEEYSHNDIFWQNFRELRELCTKLGIYEPIKESEKFCGKYIRDS